MLFKLYNKVKGVINMKNQTNCSGNLAQNLCHLRKQSKLSQEKLAEKIGVTRQAVAKWEAGESMPDILNCNALAELYDVALDDLVNFDSENAGFPVPPKGKYIFGTVAVGERGQIVIPKKAREIFGLKSGDNLVVLGNTNMEAVGIALIPSNVFLARESFDFDKINEPNKGE